MRPWYGHLRPSLKDLFKKPVFSERTAKNCFGEFLEKTAKTHLWEDMAVLRGGGRLATKINITFFVGIVLNIFHLTTFSEKKKQYLPK